MRASCHPPAVLPPTRRMRRRRPPWRKAKALPVFARSLADERERSQRDLQRRGEELMRTLLQGDVEQRNPGEAAGPVAGAEGVVRSERRVHQRHLETTLGTLAVEHLGYACAGNDSLHPLDAALNLPPERYSLEVCRGWPRRPRRVRSTKRCSSCLVIPGVEVPKRQAEQLVVRVAEDVDAFYEPRRAQKTPDQFAIWPPRRARPGSSDAKRRIHLRKSVLAFPAGPHERIVGQLTTKASTNSNQYALYSNHTRIPNVYYAR